MKNSYTVKEWLSLLPPEVRRMALANLENPERWHPYYEESRKVSTLADAIDLSAVWKKTPQGHAFWSDQHRLADRNKRTPAPPGIDCTVPE